jgi:hypothetical protein
MPQPAAADATFLAKKRKSKKTSAISRSAFQLKQYLMRSLDMMKAYSQRVGVMYSKERADQAAGGVFLIGLAILFMTGFWWPGIMFVIGASAIARGVAEGQDWYNVPGGLSMIGLGLLFWQGFSWPLLLIFIGASMLLGKSWHNWQKSDGKPKREDKPKNDEPYYIDENEDGTGGTVEDLMRKPKNRA